MGLEFCHPLTSCTMKTTLAPVVALLLSLFATRGSADAQTLTRRTLDFGGQARVWFEGVSAALPAGRPAPLVVALHGFNNRGDTFAVDSEWAAVAEATGAFLAVFPNGGQPIGRENFAWHDFSFDGSAPDDTGFLLALVNQLVAEGRADPNRIFLTGFSDGGAMALQFLCSHPEVPAAYSPWSGSWFTSWNEPLNRLARVVPLPVWVWGNDGETFLDGTEPLTQEVREQVQYFVGAFGNAPDPARTENDGPRTTRVFTGGRAEVRFTLYANGGHEVHPGTAAKVWNEFFSRATRGGQGSPTPPLAITVCTVTADVLDATRAAPAHFLVSRTGDRAADLSVSLAVGGSAVSGVDYKSLPDRVVIPAGSAATSLKVKPRPAARAGGPKVKLTLLPGDGYTPGDPARAKVRLVTGE